MLRRAGIHMAASCVPSFSPLMHIVKVTPALLQEKAIMKLVKEFNYLRAQAQEPLSTFLRYIQVFMCRFPL